jgi:ArsR family transcriptional regulator, arsenate/arsenite/antimonite-responsive transcriptional repressor
MAALPLTDVTAVAACCSPVTREPVTADEADRLSGIFKAVADPSRLRLLSIIASHDGGEACVCDLTEPLELSQPTVSHHLKVLAEAGLVTRDKRGKWAYFAVVPDALDALGKVLTTGHNGSGPGGCC